MEIMASYFLETQKNCPGLLYLTLLMMYLIMKKEIMQKQIQIGLPRCRMLYHIKMKMV